jgi:tetratricopeptide (TPR) repeat protein
VALTAFALFVLALLLRLAHLWQIRRAPFFTLMMGDSRAYDEWARRIAAGDWIGREVFYQAPLYPYFLAIIHKTLGRDPLTVRIVQAAIGSASCALLFLAGRRFFSEHIGLLAGVGLAVWAPAIFFDALIQKSVLDVFFVCVILWLLSGGAMAAPFGPSKWLCLGVVLGALALTRENALIFVAVIGVFAWSRPGRFRNLLLLGAGVAIVLLPVAVRNASVSNGGFFITTSQFGPNFYIGNHAGADGTYSSLRYGRGAPEFERQDATELAERAAGRSLGPGEVSSYWTNRAITFITSQPAAWLALVGRKVVLLVNATEMIDTESQETHAEWSWPLRALGPITHFGVLVPLALLGIWATWADSASTRMLVALTAAYAASVVMFYVFARYRYPLVPLLMLFAAAGALELPAVATRRAAVPLALMVAAAIVCNWPVISRDWLEAVSENNIAVTLQAEGRFDEAVAHYQRAAQLRPDYAPAMNNLGTALRAAGRLDEAITTYERALANHADFPDVHYNLANVLTDAGRGAEAIKHFEIALAAMPDSADVHNNLGIVFAAQGRADDAIAQFREAVRQDPQSAKAHRNLGDSLLARGAVEEGLREMRAAAALAPGDGSVHYDLGSALLEQGHADEAVKELTEAVNRLPQDPEAHNNLGIALGMSGRFDEAITQFREALRIKPEFADARRNLDMALASRRQSP